MAQFAKRFIWSDMRACAVDGDEAYVIRGAIEVIF
ncbi:DUF7706 family protein [Cupriavidus metallidurans]